jgi:Flp pilus assembly pilin Flp
MAFYGWAERTRSTVEQETGQTMAEYAVVLGVITPAVIVTIALLSNNVADLFSRVAALF